MTDALAEEFAVHADKALQLANETFEAAAESWPAWPAKAQAPYTSDQIASLNGYQLARVMHPFTCGNEHNPHRPDLVAHEDGWHCPVKGCGYRQDWAHAFMADWTWRRS
jgi:hypothetical protein